VTDTWEQHADWWQREFTDGADPEYEEQILPLVDRHMAGTTRVLDVGCGEGQVARRMTALGASVTGVDPTVAQITVARERGGGPVYARADAGALPFADAAFDGVIMCLVLEHIVEMEPVVADMARVLRAGGRFVLMLNHPLLQAPGSGWVIDTDLDEQYWRVGPYLTDDISDEEVAPGVDLLFVHRPLSRYVNAMADCGLLVEHMAEPPPPPGFTERAPEYRDAEHIPRLLVLAARKHP
jgi:SAM-dependent methyltransferase